MTYSSFDKVYKQLKVKPAKWNKYLKHNKPKQRSCGFANRKCKRCGRIKGHVGSYGLGVCRSCFREVATALGFKKYN